MASSLFKLVGSIYVENSEANKKLNETGKNAESLGSKFSSALGTAVKFGAGVATAVAGASSALLGVATSASASLDEIQKGAQQLGISYESYQKLSYACERSGTSVDSLSKGIKNLTKIQTGMVKSDSNLAIAFGKLNVATKDANGNLRDTEDVMMDTLYALADMEDETTRNAYASQIFGGAYQDLAPLLNQGADGIAELTQKCEELGLVMSDDAVDAGAEFQDQLADIKDEFSAIVTKIGADVMPIVRTAFDWIQEHMPQIEEAIGNVFTGIQGFLDLILPILDNIKTKVFEDIVPKIIEFITSPEVQAFVNGVIQFFQDAYNWVVETLWPKVTEVAGGIWDKLKEIFNWAKDTAWPKIKEIAGWIWDKAKEIYNWINENVIPKLKEVYDRIQQKMPEIKKAFDVFFEACSKALTAIMNALDDIWKLLKEYVWPAVEMFIDSPYLELWIEWVIDCLKSITTYIEGFSKVLAVFRGDWSTAWDGAWTVISGFVKNALTTFNPLYQLIKGIIDMIKWIAGEEEVSGTVKTVDSSSSASIAFGHATAKYEEKSKDYKEQVETLDLSGRVNKMAKGGTIASSGTAIVGEAGAELIEMPRGAKVTPLNDNNNAFADMSAKLDTLIAVMQNFGQMGVYINGEALVGEIAGQMDTTLGSYARRAGRGV